MLTICKNAYKALFFHICNLQRDSFKELFKILRKYNNIPLFITNSGFYCLSIAKDLLTKNQFEEILIKNRAIYSSVLNFHIISIKFFI